MKKRTEKAFFKSVYKRLRGKHAQDAFYTSEVDRIILDAFRSREEPKLVASFINEMYG